MAGIFSLTMHFWPKRRFCKKKIPHKKFTSRKVGENNGFLTAQACDVTASISNFFLSFKDLAKRAKTKTIKKQFEIKLLVEMPGVHFPSLKESSIPIIENLLTDSLIYFLGVQVLTCNSL